MTTFLDTSVLVRYLRGTPPAQHAAAAGLLDSEEPLVIGEVVLAETAFVLESFYRVSRDEIVDALIALLARPNIETHVLDKALAIEALILCRPSRRVSFADALTWAVARAAEASVVVTLDARFPGEGIQLHVPA